MNTRICYYVTSHGYGHGVRTAAVCNCLPPQTRLTLRTTIAEQFFREELSIPFTYAPAVFDCGCLQTDGVTVNIDATVARYTELSERNASVLNSEVQWLSENQFDIVVSDITPFAFEAALKAGIPSIAIANFTWHDIYSPYCDSHPSFAPVVEHIRKQYALASLLIEAAPALPMPYFARRWPVPVIGKVGVCKQERLRAHFSIPPEQKLALIYTGNFGMERIDWTRLERFADWFFLGVFDLGTQVSNFAQVPKSLISYRDLAASVDCIVAKVGYGILSDCLLNAVPLIYLPREQFAEYPCLEHALIEWGHAYPLTDKHFIALDWEQGLARAASYPAFEPVSPGGASQAASLITSYI